MKRSIQIILSLVFFGLCSCEKEPDNQNPPSTQASEYVVSNLSMNIPTEGGECSFAFKTSDSWTASVINGRADGWLTFSPTSGQSGSVTVVVKASGNEGYEDRSATLRIVSGKNTTDLLITQKQKDALLVTTTKYEIPKEGGIVSVEVKSNVSYSYTMEDADGWVTDNTAKTKALETRTLSFAVEANAGTDRREGRIVFTDGTLKEVVSIYQEGNRAPEKPDIRILLSEKEITMDANGGTVRVEAVSDRNISIRIPDGYEWIQEGNSESTNTFYLTITGNDSSESREGFVSFTDAESGFSENVNILQMGKDAIAVAKSNYSFGLEGGTLTMDVVANKQVDASSDADWLYMEAGQSTGSRLVFTIARANAGTDRTGTITLRSGTAVQTITVRQYPQDNPISFKCQAVKDRLVALFDVNGDEELSYKEAADVTTLMNVFNEVSQQIYVGVHYDDEGNLQPAGPFVRYQWIRSLVDIYSITSFNELQYFSGLTEIAPYAFYQMPYLNQVTLPSGIKVIDAYAFADKVGIRISEYEQGRRGLDTIVLPEGLESIGDYAFCRRPLSNGIVFPSSLKSIGLGAFSECCYWPRNQFDMGETVIGLKNIVIPESVEYIGCSSFWSESHYGDAFSGCLALESVEIPATIQYISADSFTNCSRLKTITGSAVSRDGHAVVNKDGVLMFLIGGKLNEYAIPDGVKRVLERGVIGDNLPFVLYLNDGYAIPRDGWLFHSNGSEFTTDEIDAYWVKTITIPSSFEKPAQNGFRYLRNLESFKGRGATSDGKGLVIDNCLVSVAPAANPGFNIPSDVTEIGPDAFAYSQVAEVIIPDAVQTIGNFAFYGCVDLESVTLPKGWATIVDGMFCKCANLTQIHGMESINEIGISGLYGCNSLLKRFKVPASVKILGGGSLAPVTGDKNYPGYKGPFIIELQSLTPPELTKVLISNKYGNYQEEGANPFGSMTTAYVPDIAYERYHSKYYGWENISSRKLSELYSTPVFHVREFDEWRGEHQAHILRITEEGKDEYTYHYDLIKVEAGSFERKVPSDPSTTVTVNITKDYYMAATEFPQWLWLDVMHCNPSEFTEGYVGGDSYYGEDSDFRPVETVTWEDSNEFLQELNKLTGLSMRLPTEAEWEYAARGGKYSNGRAYSGDYSTGPYTIPCGLGLANELGLHDMHGNVWEYCQDYYGGVWRGVETVPCGDDPIGPVTTPQDGSRVVRGGSYRYYGYSYYDSTTHERISDGFIGVGANRQRVGENTSLYHMGFGFRPAL